MTKQFKCLPLFETNNEKEKDRINIVFIGSESYGNIETFKYIAKELISIDGNHRFIPYMDLGNNIFLEESIDWGLFAVEPFKSNKNKFNVWYLNELLDDASIRSFDSLSKYCDLSYLYLAKIDDKQIEPERPSASPPNFVHKKDINKNNLFFGISIDFINLLKDNKINTRKQFVHEVGHAVFGLQDEYAGSDTPLYGYPSCAHNISEAQEWWGDSYGKIDPSFYDYKKAFDENKLQLSVTEEDFRTTYFYGGCYIPYGDNRVVKPTKESIMGVNQELPVFGLVNKKRIEQVLSLFSGDIVPGTILISLPQNSVPYTTTKCIAGYKCYKTKYVGYQDANCKWNNIRYCSKGCSNSKCNS
jgi:hypothetical protein